MPSSYHLSTFILSLITTTTTSLASSSIVTSPLLQQQQHEDDNMNNNNQHGLVDARNLAAQQQCTPPASLSKQDCQYWSNTFICQGQVAWMGASCGPKYNDGGCQRLTNGVYCDWKCKTRCLSRPGCVWHPHGGGGCQPQNANCDGVQRLQRNLPRFTQGASLRVPNWATPTLIDTVNVTSPFHACRFDLFLTSVKGPPVDNQLFNLVVQARLIDKSPTSDPTSTHAPITNDAWPTVTYILAETNNNPALLFPGGQSATTWFSLSYVVPPLTRGFAFDVPGVYEISFSFPSWRAYPFALLTSATTTSSSHDTCVDSISSPSTQSSPSSYTPTTPSSSPSISPTNLCTVLSSPNTQHIVFNVFS